MINKYNIAELSLVDRPINSTHSGFGAIIPRHENTHGMRRFQTENRDFYGQVVPPGPEQTVTNFQKLDNVAGTRVRPLENQKTKIISNLVGEVYSKEYDPQE